MLPKITTMVYDCPIPGTTMSIKYRPMIGKEYKILLQAREFEDRGGFVNAVKGIVSDCLFNAIDVDSLPIYVVDFIFLKIFSKSNGEFIDSRFKCNHQINTGATDEHDNLIYEYCGAEFGVKLNLNDVTIKYPENFNKKSVIKLTDTVGIEMRSPSFSRFSSVEIEGKGILNITDEYIYSCVECIYDGDNVLLPEKDFTLNEFQEFFESMTSEKIREIAEFLKNQPIISMDVNITCPSCKNKTVVELKGIDSFFD